MLGAIIGDVVGSRFEFNNIKTTNFKLFNDDSVFTDDTVMTIAVTDWVLHAKDLSDKNEAITYLKKWGKKYPNAGYGGRFYYWVLGSDTKPYNSCGNGSAMRISSVGHLFNNEEEMLKACRTITSITHNHPEGMKGAEVVATIIYSIRNKNWRKSQIKEYAIKAYPELQGMEYEDLVENYKHGPEICQVTVPQAIYCFLRSMNFEDCIRTTMSIGGDCDTTAAISCAIAEAYYKEMPIQIIEETKNRLPKEMLDILEEEYKEESVNDPKTYGLGDCMTVKEMAIRGIIPNIENMHELKGDLSEYLELKEEI